ncbi:MAG: amidohydrolase family protein, partial [Bacteroidales bacterium]|nr:amidohydrolase family protein [Bacteroidales bacterium]
AKYGNNITADMHPLIRSRDACFRSTSRAVALAEKYGTRLHLLHISTVDELKLLSKETPSERKNITAEVCVNHLWFDDTCYEILGNSIKCNPAIKTRFDREALITSVNNDITDVIASDHAPHTIEEKNKPYPEAPSGIPVIQHSLVAMLELWHKKLISLEKIVEKMCHNPAILFNISKRGFIREGYKADLCLFDPVRPWTVTKDNIFYKCGWSPFENTTFRSGIVMTFVNGNIVFHDGIVDANSRGEKLVFERH